MLNRRRLGLGVPPVWVMSSSIRPEASSLFKVRTDLPNRSCARASTLFLSSLCSRSPKLCASVRKTTRFPSGA